MQESRWPWLAVAGLLLLAIGVLVIYSPNSQDLHIVAPADGNRTVTLADGSKVTLAPGTRMRSHLGQSQREVFIQNGEAFVRVAWDLRRPFVVHARHRRITALRTVFNVRTKDILRVAVIEGAVSVVSKRPHEPGARVSAGQEATFLRASSPPRVMQIDREQVMAWLKN